MSEVQQRTDDESVELGTVLQLAPHEPRTKVNAEDGGPSDGKGYISLDEVYEQAGTESIAILAANCAEFSKNRRLSPAGMSVLRLDGCESFMPGFDRLNGIKGGESFVDALKKGFLVVIKVIKTTIIKILDWCVSKIRIMLGFEKTEKEIAIVAEQTNNAQGAVSRLLTKISEGVGFKFDFNEFYDSLPPNVTSGEIFNIVHARGRNAAAQVEKLATLKPVIASATEELMKAGQVARNARAKYKRAVDELREAAKGDVSEADIIKFRNALESEVAGSLDPSAMTKATSQLLTEIYNIDLKGTGLDSTIKGQMQEFRQQVAESQPLVLDPALAKRIMELKGSIHKVMAASAMTKYDPEEMKALKDLINVADAELLETISTKTGKTGLLEMGYTEYSNIISTYVQHADLLSSILTTTKKTMASLAKWTNNVDKLTTAYVADDIRKIISVQNEIFGEDAKEFVTDKGNLNTVVDYDGLFIARHPKFSAAVTVWRAEGAKLYKKYNGLFREVNKLLASIGVRTI